MECREELKTWVLAFYCWLKKGKTRETLERRGRWISLCLNPGCRHTVYLSLQDVCTAELVEPNTCFFIKYLLWTSSLSWSLYFPKGVWEINTKEARWIQVVIIAVMDYLFPSKFICCNITPSAVVLGGRAFGRCLGHAGGALMNGISALIKETLESPPALFHYVRLQWQNSCQWGNRSYQTWNLLAPGSWTPQPPEL